MNRLIARYTREVEKNSEKLSKITAKIEDLKQRLAVMSEYYFGQPIIDLENRLLEEVEKGKELMEETDRLLEYIDELEEALVSGITVPTMTPPTPASPDTEIPKAPDYGQLLLKFKDLGTSLNLTETQMLESVKVAQEGAIPLKHFMQYGLTAEDSARLAQALKEVFAAKGELLNLVDEVLEKSEEYAIPLPPNATSNQSKNPALKDVESTAKAIEEFQWEEHPDGNGQTSTDKYNRLMFLVNVKEYAHEHRGLEPKDIAEAYHKAIKDGSNPELVEAVEQSLKETPKAETPTPKGNTSNEVGQAGSGGVVDVNIALEKELNELGQKQLTKDFNSLSEATKPEQVAAAIVNIEQNKNQGARLSKEQEQQLSEAKAKLKQQGYEIVDYNIVRSGENTIVQGIDFYDNQKDVLTEEQANAIESKINTLEKRGEEVNVDDLPSPISRTIKPLIKKDGKMVQAAEVNTLIFESVEQAKEAIRKSKEAGYKKPNAADKIKAKAAEQSLKETTKASNPTVQPKAETPTQKSVPEKVQEEGVGVGGDAEAKNNNNIENEINDVRNAKTKEEFIKASERLVGMNPYDAGAVSMGTRAALMTPSSFERGKELFLDEIKNTIEIKRQAESKAVEQSLKETPTTSNQSETEDVFDMVEDSAFEVDMTIAPVPVRKNQGGVTGMKQEYPSTSGAHRSTLFFEKRGKDKNIQREGIPIADDTTIPTVLDPKKLLPGTKVRIEIDFEYKGDSVLPNTDVQSKAKAVPQQFLSAQDLLANMESMPAEDTPEFEKLVQELPLKITLEGKTVQWLHLPKWILSKDPRTDGTQSEDYRNVVDSKIDPITGDYIIEPGNALREAAHLSAIRRSILKMLAKGETVEVEVDSKSEGILLKAADNFSALNLREVRIQGGEAKTVAVPIGLSTDHGILGLEQSPQIVAQLNPEYEIPVGRVVALIPMADGSRVPVPLGGQRLSELPGVVHTIHRALELFLGPHNAEELDTVEDLIGFNLKTKEDLRNYFAQYFTYFTSPNALRKGVNLVFANKQISVITVTDAGTREVTLEIDPATKRLTTESTSAINNLLQNRYKAVAFSSKERNLKGLNSSEEFTEVQYNPETGWKKVTHTSYNSFLLKDMTSPVTALNNPSNGLPYTAEQGAEHPRKYFFYGVNPIVQYNFQPVLAKSKLSVDEALIPVQIAVKAEEAIKQSESLFEDLLSLEDKAIPIQSVGTQQTEIISLESLTELYNFTPQSDRNDLTPIEVLVKMRQLNVSHIPPGYNPFKRC